MCCAPRVLHPRKAIALGYTQLDCADRYGNQAEIGAALATLDPTIRSTIWITTKLWNNDHDPNAVGPAVDRMYDGFEL